MTPRVSIVIPLHVTGDRFARDLQRYFELDYPDYEIVVVTDAQGVLPDSRVRHLVTGRDRTSPAEKRDFALQHCRGDVCAFIDDDAYPDPAWLKNAVRHFDRAEVAAVGGPGVTPPTDGLLARAGGTVYESLLGSGGNVYRFTPRPRREVDDYPAYNLLIRKSVLEEVGGFGSTFYGGEDTKVCLAIVRTGRKIVYEPEAVVYHHRRALFAGHIRQIYNVGVHRGFFVKRFPETSRRALYFLPTAGLIAALVAIVLAIVWPPVRIFVGAALATWGIATFVSAWMASRDPVIAALASLGITATHVAYGAAFFRGLTLRHLDR